MKLALVLSVFLTSMSSFAAASYHCTNSDNGGNFMITMKAGNNIGYQQLVTSAGTPWYYWKATLRPTSAGCGKNASCYSGGAGASPARVGASIPKTLIKIDLEVETKLLNGAQSGKVKKTTLQQGTKSYTCHMLLK